MFNYSYPSSMQSSAYSSLTYPAYSSLVMSSGGGVSASSAAMASSAELGPLQSVIDYNIKHTFSLLA